MKLKLSTIAASAILALTIVGCGSSSSSDNTTKGRTAINDSTESQAKINKVADDVIKATYATLGVNATALKTALGALEDGATDAEVTAARTAWKAARAPWEASEAYIVSTTPSVGNATDGNTDSWPVNSAAEIAKGLDAWNGDTITIQNADGEIKGFHTIEYYLFGDGTAVESAADAATRLNLSAMKPAKYLNALGIAFEKDILGLTSIWTADGEDATAINTFKGLNKADAVANLVQGCIDIATEVADGKIADPIGASKDNTDTTKVESQFSWNSTADFYNNIHSIKKVWEGGLKDLVVIAGADATQTGAVDSAITTSLEELATVSALDNTQTTNGTQVIEQANAFRNKMQTVDGHAQIVKAQEEIQKLTKALETIQTVTNK